MFLIKYHPYNEINNLIKEYKQELEKREKDPTRIFGTLSSNELKHKLERILKEHYGIEWKSPAKLNPHIMFD